MSYNAGFAEISGRRPSCLAETGVRRLRRGKKGKHSKGAVMYRLRNKREQAGVEKEMIKMIPGGKSGKGKEKTRGPRERINPGYKKIRIYGRSFAWKERNEMKTELRALGEKLGAVPRQFRDEDQSKGEEEESKVAKERSKKEKARIRSHAGVEGEPGFNTARSRLATEQREKKTSTGPSKKDHAEEPFNNKEGTEAYKTPSSVDRRSGKQDALGGEF